MLFCKKLPTNTTSAEIFTIVNSFFLTNNIDWQNCLGVCTASAACMTSRHTGLWAKLREIAINATFTHCIIHREYLAARKMNEDLKIALDTAVKVVNVIKSRPLNNRLLASLCDAMCSDHEQLLLHTEVRWLSRAKVFSRLYELREEVLHVLLEIVVGRTFGRQ